MLSLSAIQCPVPSLCGNETLCTCAGSNYSASQRKMRYPTSCLSNLNARRFTAQFPSENPAHLPTVISTRCVPVAGPRLAVQSTVDHRVSTQLRNWASEHNSNPIEEAMSPSAGLLPRRSWLHRKHRSQAAVPRGRQHVAPVCQTFSSQVSACWQQSCSLSTAPLCSRSDGIQLTRLHSHCSWQRITARRPPPPAALSGDSMQDFLVGSSLATAIGAAVFYGTRVSAVVAGFWHVLCWPVHPVR